MGRLVQVFPSVTLWRLMGILWMRILGWMWYCCG